MTWTVEEVAIDSPLLDQAAFTCAQRLVQEGYENILVLVAKKDGVPQAALVASMFIYLFKAEIEHLALYENATDPTGMQALLSKAETRFQKYHITIAVFLFSETRHDKIELEKQLYDSAWSRPKPMIRQYFIDIASLKPNWLLQERRLPLGYELFSWTELTKSEQRRIKVQANQGYYPYDVFPYGRSGNPHSLTSVGLRAEGKVIGWMATHQIDPLTLAYSALYIDAAWRAQKLSMNLLTEAIRRHKATSIPNAYFKLNLKRISDDWYSFVKEGLAPHAYRIEDILISQKRVPKIKPQSKIPSG